MDNAWRWFFSGILVGLICTALALVVIDPVGRLGFRAMGPLGRMGIANSTPMERTFVLVVDESGRVVSERTELVAAAVDAPTRPADVPVTPAAPAGPVAPAEPTPTPTPGLTLATPIMAKVEQPSFLAAREGLAYVVTRKLELKTVNYKGEVKTQSTEGIRDLGASRIADVDVTGNGSIYVLVVDGPFEWRVFRRTPAATTWSAVGSDAASGWPAAVQAMAVTDAGVVYLTATDPAGVFRLEADGTTLRPWVEGGRALGIDTMGDDSRLLYVTPETAPRRPEEQVRVVQSGAAQRWLSTYGACGDASRPSPSLPRDVAVLPVTERGGEPALVVDSNHVVWYQERFGAGYPIFGVPCESGADASHLNGPRGVAIDNLGNVFISDAGNGRVVVLPRPGAVPTPTPKARATAKATTEATAPPTPVPSPPSTSEAAPAPLSFVEFGNPGACPPAGRCPEADVMVPKDLTVRAGDSVRFNIRAQSHQVAIYAPGTRLEDLNRDLRGGAAGTPGADAVLIDPNRRVATSPVLPFVQPAPGEWDWDTRGLGPGAYLVICTFRPHLDVGMYGTVVVQ